MDAAASAFSPESSRNSSTAADTARTAATVQRSAVVSFFITTCGLGRAVRTYKGDSLSGFSLRDGAEFEEWQMSTAAWLKREYTGVLARLVRDVDVDDAISYARRWVDADPLDEDAHRALIRLHTQ